MQIDTTGFWYVGEVLVFKEFVEVANCQRRLFRVMTLQWHVDSLQQAVHSLLYCASHHEPMNCCRPTAEDTFC